MSAETEQKQDFCDKTSTELDKIDKISTHPRKTTT